MKITLPGTTLFQGRFTTVTQYELLNEKNGDVLQYECVSRRNSVTAIVFDRDREKYFFVRQFRVGAKKPLIELVAGMLDKENEDPETAIVREIEEELGFSVEQNSLRRLASFYSSPGGFEEKMHLYYAEVSERINHGGGVDDEQIEIIEWDRDQVASAVFEDAKTIIGQLYILKGVSNS